ncbi:hypothetical protein K469DRAFT_783460 [Zopfia rhizophila CBS 207.26]|uniref:ARS-binding protein 1 N-terminal domain-containing protein n=1 Tax=Zopfia rhizophila CBS 207.26 TaxID=1314779 RepID=A0A6A6EU84_9PEZI|nr:hypothetical protein K469DRAFT_783460 [Zopfia rhizophila CBS 207.26]
MVWYYSRNSFARYSFGRYFRLADTSAMAELSHLQNFYLRRFTINRLPYLNYRTIESTLMPPKAISDVERQALRACYFSQKPQPEQKDIIAWFEQ